MPNFITGQPTEPCPPNREPVLRSLQGAASSTRGALLRSGGGPDPGEGRSVRAWRVALWQRIEGRHREAGSVSIWF